MGMYDQGLTNEGRFDLNRQAARYCIDYSCNIPVAWHPYSAYELRFLNSAIKAVGFFFLVFLFNTYTTVSPLGPDPISV